MLNHAVSGLLLRDLEYLKSHSLAQIMDEASREAKARGLTPELLDSFLKEKSS